MHSAERKRKCTQLRFTLFQQLYQNFRAWVPWYVLNLVWRIYRQNFLPFFFMVLFIDIFFKRGQEVQEYIYAYNYYKNRVFVSTHIVLRNTCFLLLMHILSCITLSSLGVHLQVISMFSSEYSCISSQNIIFGIFSGSL